MLFYVTQLLVQCCIFCLGVDDIKSPASTLKGSGGLQGTVDLGLPSQSIGLDADLSGGKKKGGLSGPSLGGGFR